MKSTVDGVDAQGKPTHTEVTTMFDGKSSEVKGAPDANTTRVYRRIDNRTYEYVQSVGGKLTTTVRTVVAADGKTRTVTTTGKNAQGQTVNNVAFSIGSNSGRVDGTAKRWGQHFSSLCCVLVQIVLRGSSLPRLAAEVWEIRIGLRPQSQPRLFLESREAETLLARRNPPWSPLRLTLTAPHPAAVRHSGVPAQRDEHDYVSTRRGGSCAAGLGRVHAESMGMSH